MPIPKRSSKIVSYDEQDDDDFISIKKPRTTKKDEKPKQKEPERSLKPIIVEDVDKESTSSQSNSDVDEDDEISSKNKRIEHNEEEESEPVIHQDLPIETPENRPTRSSDIPRQHSSLPLGFPTSKIHIPSPHVSRVGLSRKSLPIKPLHPNLISRVVPQ